MGVLKQQVPEVPILALTATATEQVCRDVTEILGITGAELFQSSVDRPNLFYEVRFYIYSSAMPVKADESDIPGRDVGV